MNKKQLIQSLRDGVRYVVTSPKTHKYYGVPREADIIQTNAIRFDGGSWLYFADVKATDITDRGFRISDLCGGFIEYEKVRENDR